MDLGERLLKPPLLRASSSRDGLNLAPGSPVAASRSFSNATAALLRAENATHRQNNHAMREVLAEVAALPAASETESGETSALHILQNAVVVLDEADRMLSDVAETKSPLQNSSSGCLSPFINADIGDAARGLLRQYDPSGVGDPTSFRDNARLAAVAYDALVVRRAATAFARRSKKTRFEEERPSSPALAQSPSPSKKNVNALCFDLAWTDLGNAICSWRDFDAIALDTAMRAAIGKEPIADADADATKETPAPRVSGILQKTTLAAMEHLGLFEKVPAIKKQNVANFLKALEKQYASPEYHSAVHAADVVQAVLFILAPTGLESDLVHRINPTAVFALLIAASAHDVGHPGLNNAFLCNTEDPRAARWNDVSVNENGHLHVCLSLLKEHKVFDGLPENLRKQCKATIGRLILSTDMAHHTRLVEEFVDVAANAIEAANLGGGGGNYCGSFAHHNRDDGSRIANWKDPTLSLCFVLHCADISNPARPWGTAREWGRRVTEEFHKQGDCERARGVQVAALNDRNANGGVDKTTAANQAAFLEYVVEPTLSSLATIAPNAVEVMMKHLCENRYEYQRVVAGASKK
jgi:cAMP-specific phosphodiesterase 4